MELLPAIHHIPGVTCNVYLIVEPDGLTLIDTGLPGSSKRVVAYLRGLGRDIGDVRRILLTHQHVDHVGNAAQLAASGAEVVAHPTDAPAIAGTAPRELPKWPLRPVFQLALLPRLRSVTVTRLVRAGEVVPVLPEEGGLQVVETPGHTLGQIAFYLPGRRLLFAGDAYNHAGTRIAAPPAMFTTDMPLALRSLASLAALDIDASLPGHGEPMVTGAGERLAEAIRASS